MILERRRSDLRAAGLHDTAKTLQYRSLHRPLAPAPDNVTRDIQKAVRKRKNTTCTPPFRRGIILVIRTLPESLLKRLSL